MISRSWHFFPTRGRGGRAVPQAQYSSLRRDFGSLVVHLCRAGIVQAYGSFGAPHMRIQGEIYRDSAPPAPPEGRQHYCHRPPSAPTHPKRAPHATGPGARAAGALGTRPSTPGRHSGANARLRAVAASTPPPPGTPYAGCRRRAAAHARRPAATRMAAMGAGEAARAMEGAAEGSAGTQRAAAGAAAGGAAAAGRAAGWRLGGGSAGRLGGGLPSPVEAGRRGVRPGIEPGGSGASHPAQNG